MRKLLSVMLILSSLPVVGLAQHEKSPTAISDIRVSKNRPSVFLTFERFGKAINPMEARLAEKGGTSKSKEKGEDIWLRLHNNTRVLIEIPTWSLYLTRYQRPDGSTAFGLSDGMEVSALYGVLESDGRHVLYGGDSFSNSLLPPGRSVIFSVSRDHLSKNRSIFVWFRYEWEWESRLGYAEGKEPSHRAEFYSYQLPEK